MNRKQRENQINTQEIDFFFLDSKHTHTQLDQEIKRRGGCWLAETEKTEENKRCPNNFLHQQLFFF